ncbi:MAG: cupin domain-containing protein, partial [Clostridia bacterium]|nr:cupin domain-containing protein [Clostridia bacterium]
MGYPKDILSTRSIVKPGEYAVIPPTGLVNNVIPGIEGCRVSIVASPKYGASFVQYVITAQPGGGTTRIFGNEPNIETFIYVIEGTGTFTVDGKEYEAKDGAY